MNGFANAILTLLLGWLRSLFDALWALLGSDGGGSLLSFLRAQWKLVFLVLCVGRYVLDRVIYFIRWRPDYLWSARRQARRAEREGDAAYDAHAYPHAYAPPSPQQEPPPDPWPDATARYQRPAPAQAPLEAPTFRYEAQVRPQPPAYMPPPASYAPEAAYPPPAYAPQPTPYAPRAAAYASPPAAYTPPPTDTPSPRRARAGAAPAAPPPYAQGETVRFSPDASFAPTAAFRPLATHGAPLDAEPLGDARFDEDLAAWSAPAAPLDRFAPRLTPERNPASGMAPAFGAAQPEPRDYLRDVQAGYAPAPPPEQRYAPRPEPPTAEPVHPGLDLETFQQNIGLTNPEALESTPRRSAEESFPNFTPFSDSTPAEAGGARPRGFGALAKRARSFVSGDDEKSPLSIRDLQPTVDVKSAFHAPVYPKKRTEGEEE